VVVRGSGVVLHAAAITARVVKTKIRFMCSSLGCSGVTRDGLSTPKLEPICLRYWYRATV
jgi:hypothetical protein